MHAHVYVKQGMPRNERIIVDFFTGVFERVLRRRIMTLPGAGEVEANVLLSEERLTGPI